MPTDLNVEDRELLQHADDIRAQLERRWSGMGWKQPGRTLKDAAADIKVLCRIVRLQRVRDSLRERPRGVVLIKPGSPAEAGVVKSIDGDVPSRE